MSGSPKAGADADKQKAREKLRAFYKTQARSSTQPQSSSSLRQQVELAAPTPSDTLTRSAAKKSRRHVSVQRIRNPLDIDTAAFDSKKYLKKLLVDKGVAGLLEADNELVTEIRHIDGDMKTMVYENYSKFISATETIRKMKEDADYMDAEMEKLTKRVNEISTRTDTVNSKFAEKREAIQRLNAEHRLMSKLQFLFALPDQLNKSIGKGEFVEAARLWSRTQPLLEHYRQLGVFASVEKDGKEIMASVENTIWSRWRDPATDVSEGAECASLLALLRPEKVGELWREYLEIQSTKNRNLRQAALTASYVYPVVCDSAVQTPHEMMGTVDPDPSGAPLPVAAAAKIAGAPMASQIHSCQKSRTAHFNEQYLPVWNSLVIGFASQFVSPTGTGILDKLKDVSAVTAGSSTGSSAQGRTMSLLEATTEGTVVGLLSPFADSDTTNTIDGMARLSISNKKDQLVVAWQAMSSSELSTAQRQFAEHMGEWSEEYEFIIDSLIRFPDDVTEDSVKPYLEQLDELVISVNKYPILARIGGLHDSIQRIVNRWQEHLVEGALHTIVRDLLERVEYYFDPLVDSFETNAVTTPSQMSANGSNTGGGGGVFGTIPRAASISRHRRNSSIRSATSQGDTATHQQQHQRAGSAVSGGWAGGGDRSSQILSDIQQQQQQQHQSAVTSVSATAAPQPLPHIQTQPHHMRALMHVRTLSSNNDGPNSASAFGNLSPSLNSPMMAASANRISRASTFHLSSGQRSSQNSSASKTIAKRKFHHQRTHSSNYVEAMEAMDDGSKAANDQPPATAGIQQLRRSFSLYRSGVRRYKPWIVNTVNRNAPLHVFLADIESWLIQQVLERVNPLLECVVQHYLDIESSQMLDDDEADDDDDDDDIGSSTSSGTPMPRPSSNSLQAQVASRLRQAFIKTLDRCLDTWMSSWIPDSFLYATLANPVFGTRAFVEKVTTAAPMAQYGISVVNDPVASLLLARFAVDFELTLTQSIYQLCEQGISILPDDASTGGHSKRLGDVSNFGSADASVSNLLTASRPDTSGDPGAERLYSLTTTPMARADSMASTTSRRGLGNNAARGSLLKSHQANHSAKWHSVAEKLVRHFVMTVGQDISADYLKMHPYDLHSPAIVVDELQKRFSTTSLEQRSFDKNMAPARSLHVTRVSEVWLTICRWLKQVEDDTNALFYDPIFSSTLSVLESPHDTSRIGEESCEPTARSQHRANAQAFSGANALRLGVSGSPANANMHHTSSGGYSSNLHAHILSNIDRLFAERVDIFPTSINPLSAGKILTHLAMQIIKAALEAMRLRPVVFETAAEFHQVVVDAAFVRSWVLRYAGVPPNLQHPSAVSSPGANSQPPATPAEPRRRVSRQLPHAPGATGASSAVQSTGMGASAASSPVVNERDAQAIHNLIDDWVSSARAFACSPTKPDGALVDKVVQSAWRSVYFGIEAVEHADDTSLASALRQVVVSPSPSATLE
ncbi:hypothetical protein EC988_001397, partial [Linderina pennispora]